MARINKCMSRTRNHITPVVLFGLGCVRPVDADLVPSAIWPLVQLWRVHCYVSCPLLVWACDFSRNGRSQLETSFTSTPPSAAFWKANVWTLMVTFCHHWPVDETNQPKSTIKRSYISIMHIIDSWIIVFCFPVSWGCKTAEFMYYRWINLLVVKDYLT
jgi:hypothetical protein